MYRVLAPLFTCLAASPAAAAGAEDSHPPIREPASPGAALGEGGDEAWKSAPAVAGPEAGQSRDVEEIVVVGHYQNLVGTADAASAGSYTRALVEDRPLMRPGEVEELVPGLMVTQHSGAGKANQFLLRGFNLDHGTDFATAVEGVPVNLPSHAHGQGYDDINFVIPELIDRVDYFKGPYAAAQGDFASAGAANLFYVKRLAQPLLEASAGSFGYFRSLAAASAELGGGALLLGLEAMHEDGPFVVPEDYRKYNGVLRWTRPLGGGALSLVAMGYSGQWNATEQIPLRAEPSGLSRFGTEDASDGGSSHRYSLSAGWSGEVAFGELEARAYAVKYDMDLFSNFTYFLNDPVNGDQMEQLDRRWYFGTAGSWGREAAALGLREKVQLGWDARRDVIDPVALYHTIERKRLSAWSVDRVAQSTGALWGSVDSRFTPWLRAVLGLRASFTSVDVKASDPRNSGALSAGILLPKATVVVGPWAKTELFLNYGDGYHSNDARGATATVDAQTGEAIPKVTLLPRSRGLELGGRTEAVPGVQTSVALWLLDFASELVWDADAGTTEPAGPTRRMGVEWSARWQPLRWLLFDLDVALSRARFVQADPAGQFVPEAIESAVAAGASIHRLGPWSASLFMRYFGPRALTQDDAVRSQASMTFNGQVAFQVNRNVRLSVDLFNILDARVPDMSYEYVSRLPGEPAQGVADVHEHPAEPRSLRGTLTVQL